MKTAIKTVLSISSVVLCSVLTGCGIGSVSAPSTLSVGANVVSGKVMGGQQPVVGSAIQLYEVGTTGYGSASKPLLTPGAILTNANGGFYIPAFTCDSPSSLTYMTATGGQPIANTTNANLAMMVGLGPCSTLGSQHIQINELTTVASVWSLAPFMAAIDHIGSSSSNSQGIANAFASINKVVDTSVGTIPGPAKPSNAALPTTTINTLADILQACINSSGGTASDTTDGETNGSACGKLFYLTGGSSTTDTVTAAMTIAQNPGKNVAKLNQLRAPSSPFGAPYLVGTPPTDWTIAITYTDPSSLSSPKSVATDQQGNVWVANQGGSSVTEFGPTGAVISPTGGYPTGAAPSYIAIDQTGSAWVANLGGNTVTKIGPGGASSSTTAYGYNGLSGPISIAIDATGDAFVGNTSVSTISAFTNSLTPLTGSPFTGGGLYSNGDGIYVAVSPK
jgi:hypothetical protein